MKKKLRSEEESEEEEEEINSLQVGDIIIQNKKKVPTIKQLRNILQDRVIRNYLQVRYTQKVMSNLNYVS